MQSTILCFCQIEMFIYQSSPEVRKWNSIRKTNTKAKNLKNLLKSSQVTKNLCIYLRDTYLTNIEKEFLVYFLFQIFAISFLSTPEVRKWKLKNLVKSLQFIKNYFIYFRVAMQHIWQTSKKNLKTIPIIAKVKTVENGTRNLEFDIMPEL